MIDIRRNTTAVYLGDELARYGFEDGHPFGPERHNCFRDRLYQLGLDQQLDILQPVFCETDKIALFHTAEYVNRVKQQSKLGTGYLDQGDTPAFIGMFEAASSVAGTVIDAVDRIIDGQYRRIFSPIAGLHHARRDVAAGFCVFNDCGIVIEHLRQNHGIKRVAYVDIDAHHGDGVFYSFEDDVDLIFADIHQDGRTLYPGTGDASETGRDKAIGTKLNIPMPPQSNDADFAKVWPIVEDYLHQYKPEFILLQAGADSIAGDPITQLEFTPASHSKATSSLCKIADQYCQGRMLAMGGGGYNHENIANTWTTVVKTMLEHNGS